MLKWAREDSNLRPHPYQDTNSRNNHGYWLCIGYDSMQTLRCLRATVQHCTYSEWSVVHLRPHPLVKTGPPRGCRGGQENTHNLAGENEVGGRWTPHPLFSQGWVVLVTSNVPESAGRINQARSLHAISNQSHKINQAQSLQAIGSHMSEASSVTAIPPRHIAQLFI